MRILNIIIAMACLIMASCSSKTTAPSTSTSGSRYSEDLSVLRPKLEQDSVKKPLTDASNKNLPFGYVEPKFTVNEPLHNVLDSISKINLANGFVEGFTIQIYSGIKKEEAFNTKKKLASALPEIESDLQYVQPNFRVRAGKYYDRLQAQKDYIAIKHYFPNAIVIPERIPIQSETK